MAKGKSSPAEHQDRIRTKTIQLPTIPPLPEDFHGGKYANHIVVGFSQWEFYLDFWRVDTGVGTEGAKLAFVERIIISPHNVKGLIDAMRETVESFERDWGLALPNMRGVKPRSEEG